MNEQEIIKGCIKNNRESQKALYELFYGKMLGVCLRYSNNLIDAKEVLHQGFLKIFETIKNFKETDALEDWIKKIIITTSVDHIRKNKQNLLIVSTIHANKNDVPVSDKISDDTLFTTLGKDKILKAVQELSSGYRTLYNLSVIDGYSNIEIGEMQEISEETVKLNLAKAKFTLRKNLIQILNTNNG
jgi:RNA polymerase sigma-70 factor (ECF subfamily)